VIGNLRVGGAPLPVTAVNGNIIFARGQAAAVYRVHTTSFEFLSLDQKNDLHRRLAWWAMKVESDFSVYRVCREYPVGAYVHDTVSLLDERYADRASWEGFLGKHALHMESMRSFTPEVYFVVSLRGSSLPWQRQRESQIVNDAEQAAFDLLGSHLPSRRASTHELQWLLRRAAVRGVCEPDIDPCWTPPALTVEGGVWEAGRADVQSFMPVLEEHSRSMLARGEDGESMQAMMVMGKLPKTSEYPGSSELLFAPLERLDFPVDVVSHARWLPNKKMLSVCDNAVKDAHDELEDALARFLDRQTKRRVAEVADVQDYFASDPFPPGLNVVTSFAVGAPAGASDMLKERVDRVERAYRPVRLYRPHAIQCELFGLHLLRPDGASSLEYRKDYRRLLIAEQFAAMMPIGANQGGSDVGIFIGHTIPGAARPVKYNMLEASALNRTGAILLNGILGAGKTVAVHILGYGAAQRGSLVVDVDPKHPLPDHSFEKLLPDRTHTISLADVDKHRGRLDPLVVAPNEMREELASSYMMEILPQATPEWQTEIISAVRAVLREPAPTCRRVLEHLLSSDDEHARAAGKALSVWSEWGLGKLAFSDQGEQDTDVHMPVTTIKASALTLPPAGTARASYDQSERVSVATLKLIVAKAMRMLSVDRSVHKMLIIDEAHVFGSTVDGLRFLQRVIRMGRYMNITVVLASQLLGDLAELGQLIGIRFVFRQETDEQASLNLAMLGLDPDDPKLIAMLRGFSDGRCLMRGLDGRVIAMRFDPADPDFLRIVDTNPSRASQLETV
jgi:hypothetical protein